MDKKSRFSSAVNLFFISPYVLLVFLAIPAYSILSLRLHLPVSGDLLLGNNMVFCVFVAVRIIWRVVKMRGNIRYGADCCPPRKTLELNRPALQLKQELVGAGFKFESGGYYCEKSDLGYLGATVLYGGMMILLLAGSYDYMNEYSVMGRLGVGEPASIADAGKLGAFEAGFFAGTDKLPLLQVKKQILPNAQWPQGASEIALISAKDGKELAKGTTAPRKPFRYGGMDFEMTKFAFDSLIVIRSGDAIAYENFVKFLPLREKKGEYGYIGSLVTKNFSMIKGVAWLNPADKKKIHLEATLAGKKIVDTELELWGKNVVTQGEYTVKLEGVAQWTEIIVSRSRHTILLMVAAVLAVIGCFMRVVIRPKRVWLVETEEGCQVRMVGREARELVGQ